MIKYKILTERENQIINKKLKGHSLTQNESNILSKSIRPKLKEISKINANMLLDRLEYNQKAKSIENKIKELIIKNIAGIKAILIYGSAIQTNYKEYNDIDVLIVTNKKIWKSVGEKYDLIIKLTDYANKINLNLDIQIIDADLFYKAYPRSPSLIYQLNDYKIIYGKLKLPNEKKEIYNIDLRMKLDWSDIEDIEPKGIDIYKALRNIILVRLLLNKIIDNRKLKESLIEEIGKNLIEKLKNNKESKEERRIAFNYLKKLNEITRKEIKGGLWEKIEL